MRQSMLLTDRFFTRKNVVLNKFDGPNLKPNVIKRAYLQLIEYILLQCA